ncbi:UNVERIFIED_CONTAM: hypothetical protein RMT77_005751 [Armadillidium vulgare]
MNQHFTFIRKSCFTDPSTNIAKIQFRFPTPRANGDEFQPHSVQLRHAKIQSLHVASTKHHYKIPFIYHCRTMKQKSIPFACQIYSTSFNISNAGLNMLITVSFADQSISIGVIFQPTQKNKTS